MPTFTKSLKVNGQQMEVYGSMPDGQGPFPAIVVIQHAPGVDNFIRTMADRLAAAGYAAVAPDLYHRLDASVDPAKRRELLKDREIVDDVNATVDDLRRNRAVDGKRLGITGFCMGGRVVYLMAAANPNFKAAVAYYGGNILKPWGEGVAAPLARTREIGCPLMFHFGEEDTNPSPQDRRTLEAELKKHGKVHEFFTYPKAGHAFMNFENPERHREDAAKNSWPRTLDFFSRHLNAS
jgi:carboxymethylenebutenolidase